MKRPLALHPFLFAASPILALLAGNLGQVDPAVVCRPLAVSLLGTAVICLVARRILGDGPRAALLTSAGLLLFFSYGHVYTLLEGQELGGWVFGRHRFLAPVWGGLLIAAGWGIVRRGRGAAGLTQALNLVSAGLCLWPCLLLAGNLIARGPSTQLTPGPSATAPAAGTPGPSVYYIILDGYARQDILSDVFGVDNQPFLESLRARGFQIAEASHSNYANTALSLASSLNMDYVDKLAGPLDETRRDLEPMYALIQDSRVERAFKEMGHATVAFASGYRGTELRSAEVYLTPGLAGSPARPLTGGLTPFEGMLIQTTAGLLLTDANAVLPAGLRLDLEAPYAAHRARIEFALDQVPQVGTRPQPEFVFAHLIIPHPPFVFGPNGEQIRHTAAYTLGDASYRGDYAGYLSAYAGQVAYLNERLDRLLGSLIASSRTPPVILLQSDHGSGASGLRSADGAVSYQDERFANFIAVYSPACPSLKIHPALTPVNLFRLVLRDCFHQPYTPLPDRSYFSNYIRPYALRDVTDDLSR